MVFPLFTIMYNLPNRAPPVLFCHPGLEAYTYWQLPIFLPPFPITAILVSLHKFVYSGHLIKIDSWDICPCTVFREFSHVRVCQLHFTSWFNIHHVTVAALPPFWDSCELYHCGHWQARICFSPCFNSLVISRESWIPRSFETSI